MPWGSGTKAVSSVVLIANGASFAVRHFFRAFPELRSLISIPDHDNDLHDYWLSGRLRDVRQVAAFCHDLDMLDSPVCKHEHDV